MAKLKRVGIHERFDFGGFGDDCDELRPELIRRGAERGAAKLGKALNDVRVVVIGDTPKDVSAAQAIGAESIAVATLHSPRGAEGCLPDARVRKIDRGWRTRRAARLSVIVSAA